MFSDPEGLTPPSPYAMYGPAAGSFDSRGGAPARRRAMRTPFSLPNVTCRRDLLADWLTRGGRHESEPRCRRDRRPDAGRNGGARLGAIPPRAEAERDRAAAEHGDRHRL